jgi:tellurite resistance protein TehA-like permease
MVSGTVFTYALPLLLLIVSLLLIIEINATFYSPKKTESVASNNRSKTIPIIFSGWYMGWDNGRYP